MPELDLSILDAEEQEVVDLKQIDDVVPLDKVQYKAMITTLAAKRVKNQLQIEEGEFHKYASLLQRGEEDTIRLELATEALLRKTEKVRELELSASQAGDPDLVQGLMDMEIAFDAKTEALTIIENEAAGELVDAGLASDDRASFEEADIAKALVEPHYETVSEVNQNIAARAIAGAEVMSELVEKIGFNLETLSDVGAILFPAGTPAILDQNVKTTIDPFLPGNDLKEQKAVFDAMSLEEQKKTMAEIVESFPGDPLQALMSIGYLQDLARWEVWLENAGGFLDATIIGSVAVKPILRAVKLAHMVSNLMRNRVATTALAAGNRISTVQQTEAVTASVARGDIVFDSPTAQEAAERVLETSMLAGDKPLHAGVSGWLREKLNQINGAAKEFLNTERSLLLSTEERLVLTAQMEQELAQSMIESGMRHVDIDGWALIRKAQVPRQVPKTSFDEAFELAKVAVGEAMEAFKLAKLAHKAAAKAKNKAVDRARAAGATKEQLDVLPEFDALDQARKALSAADKAATDAIMARNSAGRAGPAAPAAGRLEEDLFGLKYSVIYGDEAGQGFATAADAEKYAGLLKLDGYTVTTPLLNGTHFLQISRRATNEAGFITSTINRSEMSKRTGIFSRYLLSNTSIVGVTSKRAAHLTVGAREGAMAAAKRLEKIKFAVKGAEREWLDEVIELGTRENGGTFYSVETLQNRFHFSPKQVAAYKAFQAEEDLFHILDNSAVFTHLNSQGFKTVVLNKPIKGLEKFNAKPVTSGEVPNPANKQIWNASTKRIDRGLTTKDLERLEGKGYRIMQLQGGIESSEITPVQFVLLKATDAKIHNLSLLQVPYRPGGRIRYADKTFLKMARVRKGPGGIDIIMRAKTFGVGSAENIKDAVRMYEEARMIWVNKGTNLQMAAATEGRFTTLDAFQDTIGIRNLKSGMPFEAARDGEVLAAVQERMAKGSFLAEDLAEAQTMQRMIAQTGSSRTYRGERLPMFGANRFEDFDWGRRATIVSPLESASVSVTRAIQIMSLENFRVRQSKIWFDSFNGVMNRAAHPGRTPIGWLLEEDKAKYIKPRGGRGSKQWLRDVEAINQAKAHEQHLKMTLNVGTLYDLQRAQAADGLIAFASPLLGRLKVSEKTLDNIAQADPVQFVRKFTFATKLGLGGFNQPVVQLQAAALMVTIEPVHGIRAVLTAPVLAMMLMSENATTLGKMAKIAVRMAPGSDAKIVQEGLEVLKKTNNWRINSGSLAEQDYHHLSAPTMFSRLIELGQAPFINSERFNKIASTYAAFLKWRAANPKKAINSDVINHIRTKGEEMVASMGRVDRAKWQEGVAGMVTQFWGYPARLLEMVAPETLGGSKAFSKKQKMQIAAGQLAINGIGGTVGVGPGRRVREVLNALYSERYGENLDEDYQDLIEKGVLSGLLLSAGLDTDQVNLYTRTGAQVAESGPGALLLKLITGQWSDLATFDVAGLRTLSDVSEDLWSFSRAMMAVDPTVAPKDYYTVLSTEGLKVFTDNISSLRDAQKMAWAMQYQTFVNNSGAVTDDDVSWQRGVAKLFGIDTSSSTANFAAKNITKEINADESKTAQRLGSYLRQYLQGSMSLDDFTVIKGLLSVRHPGRWGSLYKKTLDKVHNQDKYGNELKLKLLYRDILGE
jgi:hypothetical protein